MQIQKRILAIVLYLIFAIGVGSVALGATDKYGIPKERPQECIRILQDFKIKLTTTVGTAPADVLFRRGAIVASNKIDASGAATEANAKCSHLKGNEGIEENATCTAGEVQATTKCYTLVNGEFGGIILLNTLTNISNWIFYLVLILSTLMIVYGGFTYITSAGDPTKSAKGKSIITFALIGLAVALLAKVLPSVMRFFLGL